MLIPILVAVVTVGEATTTEVVILLVYFLLIFIIDSIKESLWFIGIARLIIATVAIILFYKLNNNTPSVMTVIIILDLFFGFAERAKVLLAKESV